LETKYFSLPVEITENKSFSFDDSLIPVDIKVMHNGLNLNNSTFFDEAIENAKESLKNKPILGYIKKIDGSDEKDFAGHQIEISFGEEGIKVIYLERPLGVIPETNNYSILEEEGKKFVFCRGYLWKEYLNDGYEILKDNPKKSVSMEIAVDDYDINEDGSINITKYRYLGITILGDDVQEAMVGAELNVVGQFSKNENENFYTKIEELNNKISQYFTNNNNQSNADSIEGGDNVPDKIESMFATYNQKREALKNALTSKVIRDDDGDIIEEIYYWLANFDDEYVYVEKSHWKDGDCDKSYGRFTYSFNEESIEATITSEFEKMILVWLTEEENKKIQDDRNAFEAISSELETLKIEHSTMQGNFAKLETEVKDLREFKAQKDKEEFEAKQERIKQEKINHINTEYNNIPDDIKEMFIDKVDEYETIEDLDADICVYIVKNKVVFSKANKKDSSSIKLGLEEGKKKFQMSPYGDLF